MPLETIVVSEENLYDVLIIGSGPAGLSAATVCAKAGHKTGFVEKSTPGGKVVTLKTVNNYPPQNNISGSVLGQNLFNAALAAGAKYIFGNVINVTTKLGYIVIQAQNGQTWYCKTCIVATGTENAKLNVTGENDYFQMGISYCIDCDKSLTKNKTVVVIGEQAEAVNGALTLSTIAKKTYLLYRQQEYNFKGVTVDSLKQNGVELLLGCAPNSFSGDSFNLRQLYLYDRNGNYTNINIDFAFIEIGDVPATSFFSDKSILTTDGNIFVNEQKATKILGVFAIGDVIRSNNKSIVNAINDGEIAANAAIEYIKTEFIKHRGDIKIS